MEEPSSAVDEVQPEPKEKGKNPEQRGWELGGQRGAVAHPCLCAGLEAAAGMGERISVMAKLWWVASSSRWRP